MKNDLTSRYGIYAMIALFVYVVCCYIGFSESWSTGVMKIFMACIFSSGALFVFFCGKCANVKPEFQRNDAQNFTLAHSKC